MPPAVLSTQVIPLEVNEGQKDSNNYRKERERELERMLIEGWQEMY